MKQTDMYHEIAENMSLAYRLKDIDDVDRHRLTGRISERVIPVLEKIISRPDILCMFKCPHKELK